MDIDLTIKNLLYKLSFFEDEKIIKDVNKTLDFSVEYKRETLL